MQTYPTDLTVEQRNYILANFPELLSTKSKTDVFDFINAIFYLAKSGCQWKLLPKSFPGWRSTYNFFRKWTDNGLFSKLTSALTAEAEKMTVQQEAIIDSQSVRTGLPQSVKGIDGGKKIKGIKRHISVTKSGYPIEIFITKANVHDSKAACPLICKTIVTMPSICTVKGDLGYRGSLGGLLNETLKVNLLCIKSNFGSSGFKPIQGRWVVERTFAWLERFRRLCRNYEQLIRTVTGMAWIACAMFMLRFCR